MIKKHCVRNDINLKKKLIKYGMKEKSCKIPEKDFKRVINDRLDIELDKQQWKVLDQWFDPDHTAFYYLKPLFEKDWKSEHKKFRKPSKKELEKIASFMSDLASFLEDKKVNLRKHFKVKDEEKDEYLSKGLFIEVLEDNGADTDDNKMLNKVLKMYSSEDRTEVYYNTFVNDLLTFGSTYNQRNRELNKEEG